MTQLNSTSASGAGSREADLADGLISDLVMGSALPGGQKKAIVMLMHGNSPDRAAKAAGVHRGTLYRWMKNDRAFAEVLAECKAALHADAREQLASLMHECVGLVYDAIVQGDKQMAFKVLKSFGVLTREPGYARRDGMRTGAGLGAESMVENAAPAERGQAAGATEPHVSRGVVSAEKVAEQ